MGSQARPGQARAPPINPPKGWLPQQSLKPQLSALRITCLGACLDMALLVPPISSLKNASLLHIICTVKE